MLTEEQRAIRMTGVGASETSALLELNPYKAPIDVWLVKRGIVKETENHRTEVGSILEEGVLRLYQRRTGFRVTRPQDTRRHPIFQHVLASPDALVEDDDRGAEVKIVGSRMAHHWIEDTIPDYVLVQVAQNMAVTDRSRWDVIALIGGTDLRIFTVAREHDLEELILEAVETFWETYVETGTPPPIRDPDERRRYLLARYPGSEKTACRKIDTAKAFACAKKLQASKRALDRAKRRYDDASSKFLDLVGPDYGIEGAWGRFIAPRVAGRVDWKALAEEIAGGAVPVELIEKHRGAPYRMPRFYPRRERRDHDDV